MANAPPRATPVSLRHIAAKADEVAITYAGIRPLHRHPRRIADRDRFYNGAYRTERLPDIVTMNRAHVRITTLSPDPKIAHVLHGWGDDGQPRITRCASATSHPQRPHRHPAIGARVPAAR